MSLSVEELKGIIAAIETAHELHVDGHPGPVKDIPKEVPVNLLILMRAMRAAAELIAIKEAQPVAHVVAVNGIDARSVSANPDGEFFRLPHGTPLIRKPE